MRKICWVLGVLVACLQAAPTGMQVIQGIASASEGQIETSGRTVLSWDQFSLAEGEKLHFAQAGDRPAVLNRVRGSEKSILNGHLTSNGEIFLLNPNGILVGKQGRIETAGFIASTLEVQDAHFLTEDRLFFQGNSQACIVQEGEIKCPEGRVFLAAHKIENHGKILADSIGLIGSDVAWLQPAGLPRQFFPSTKKEEAAWIHHTGVLDASRMEEGDGGEVYLFSDGGRCEIKGDLIARAEQGIGGTVYALGEEVVFVEDSCCDVSGALGGGKALFGGDFQGKNPDIPNAQRTYGAKETTILADALQSGNGGRIIIWADRVTVYEGQGSVQGGLFGGDGGFAEVSGKEGLSYRGFIQRLAPLGKSGTLLLDPCTVTISAAATTPGVTFASNEYTFPGLSSANINSSDLQTSLNGGAVTILAATTGTGGAGTGSITVDGGVTISWAGANLLRMEADTGGILIGDGAPATLEASINGMMDIRSDGDISLNGTLSAGGTGSITIVAEGSFAMASGSVIECTGTSAGGGISISAIAGTFDIDGTISTGTTEPINIFSFETLTIAGGSTISGDGDVGMIALNNALTFNGASSSVVSTGTGDVSVQSAGELTIDTGTTISSQGGDVTLRSGSPILFAGTGGSAMTVSTNGAGTITIEGGEGFPTPSANWPVELLAGSNLQVTSVDGNISITGETTGSVGAVALAPTGASTSNISCSGTGGITVTATSSTTSGDAAFLLGSSGGGGLCRLTTNSGEISITATLSGTGSITGSSGALRIQTANTLASTSGNVTLSGTGQGSGTGGTNNYGVRIDAEPFFAATSGILSITGVGGGGSSSHGVYLTSSLTNSGPVTINGTAGAGANSFGLDLATGLTITGGAVTIGDTLTTSMGLGGTITSAGAVDITAATTLTNAAIISSSGSTVDLNTSTFNGAQSLTVSASGAATINGAIGNTTPVTPFSVTGSSISLGGGTIAAAAGGATFTGPVTLTTQVLTVNTSSGNGNITFSSTINGAQGLILNAGSGSVTYGDVIGGVTPISSFSSTATTTTAAFNITTTNGGSITFAGTVSLIDTVAFSTGSGAGSFSLSSGTITGGQALTITTGAATFGGTIGSPTPLTSVIVNASTIGVNGAHTVATGPMTYSGAVTLNGTQSFTNQGALLISFGSSITGNFPLTITSDNGAVTVTGAVNTSGSSGSAITVDAAGNILFSSSIQASSSGGGAGGEVSLTSSGGTVTVQSITN